MFNRFESCTRLSKHYTYYGGGRIVGEADEFYFIRIQLNSRENRNIGYESAAYRTNAWGEEVKPHKLSIGLEDDSKTSVVHRPSPLYVRYLPEQWTVQRWALKSKGDDMRFHDIVPIIRRQHPGGEMVVTHTYATPRVRCDSGINSEVPGYFRGTVGKGCVNWYHRSTLFFDDFYSRFGPYPAVANNISNAIYYQGQPSVLTRKMDGIAARRRAATRLCESPRPEGMVCDEYPFASTAEGGANSTVALVPDIENGNHGQDYRWQLNNSRISDGEKFNVVVTNVIT